MSTNSHDFLFRPREVNIRSIMQKHPDSAQLVVHLAGAAYVGMDRRGYHIFQYPNGAYAQIPSDQVLSIRFPREATGTPPEVVRTASAQMTRMWGRPGRSAA